MPWHVVPWPRPLHEGSGRQRFSGLARSARHYDREELLVKEAVQRIQADSDVLIVLESGSYLGKVALECSHTLSTIC